VRLPSIRHPGLRRIGGSRWRATDNDPQFVFYLRLLPFPYVVFQLRDADRPLDPRLYVDRGMGFTPNENFQLRVTRDGIYVVTLKALGEVRRLRFDPSSYPSQFEFRAYAGYDLKSIKALIGERLHGAELGAGAMPVWETISEFNRNQYKEQWNLISESEDNAKRAVSGYIDEEIYAQTAQGTVSILQEFVGIRPDDVVLEIGAGVGRVGAALAPLCREWIGTDVSENMVGHIKRRLAGFTNVQAIVTNGFDLRQIPSESIDVVYCTVVFMHLEEWERYSYIIEGFRVLKPGGRMLVDNVNLISDEGWRFFEEHRAQPPRERPPHVSRTSTPQELETYFRRANFMNIRQEQRGLWIFTCGVKPAMSDTPA
jgi:SAM-dependent methyltransferase